MKKRIAVFLLLCLVLTGCGHRHDWQEADCTHPKTCSICAKTEGEPLGHDWQEADCTHPKTCTRCGLTEGEAGEHLFSEADYQTGAVCTVCGMQQGSPLTPGFESHGLRCTAESGVSYEYITGARDDDTLRVKGKVTITERRDADKPVNLEELEGYEWRYVTISLSFDDQNARNRGVRWSFVNEDYYTIEAHDESLYQLDGGSDGFTVNWYGVDYPDCIRYYEYDNGHWDANVYYVDYGEWFRIPVGYDGVVVGVRDSSVPWNEGEYIYDVVNENAVLYRMK